MSMNQSDTWEKEFDRRWDTCVWRSQDDTCFYSSPAEDGDEPHWDGEKVKTFIRTLRKDWLRSEIEKLEGMKEDERTMMGEDIRNMRKGRNVVIQTIITRHKEELKVLEKQI